MGRAAALALMEFLRHLLTNDHGEWNVLLALTGAGMYRNVLAWFEAKFPRKYRVVHQKVRGPFFNPSSVETIEYGPFRTLLWSAVVAHSVCGDWDRVEVLVRRAPSTNSEDP